MLRKFQGEPLKPDHILAFCQASFRMTLSWAGFLMLAPGTSLSFTIFQSLLKFMSIESVKLSDHFILHHSLSFCLQSFPVSCARSQHEEFHP